MYPCNISFLLQGEIFLMSCLFVCLFCSSVFSTHPTPLASLCHPSCCGTRCVDQAGFKRFACLCYQSVGIKGVHHHAWLLFGVLRAFRVVINIMASSLHYQVYVAICNFDIYCKAYIAMF